VIVWTSTGEASFDDRPGPDVPSLKGAEIFAPKTNYDLCITLSPELFNPYLYYINGFICAVMHPDGRSHPPTKGWLAGMVNICLPEEELALNIIKDHLGAVAHAVTKALLTREWSSLAQVQARVAEDLSKEFSARPPILTGLSKGQVEDAMLVLIQQNCLDVSLPPTQILTSRAGVPRHVKFMYK
jgi:hypothetical protein